MIEIITKIASTSLFQSILILFLTIIITRISNSKGDLIFGISHQHYYSMPRIDDGGTFPVITQQVWFENAGGATLDSVEVVLNWRPQHFEVWDPRNYSERHLADGKLVLEFPYLASGDSFRLSMIETFRQDLPNVAAVRHKTGSGRPVFMRPHKIIPDWRRRISQAIFAIGISSILYLALQLVLWFVAQGNMASQILAP